MTDFTLDYKLIGCGLAQIIVSAGDQEAVLFAFSHSDALGEMTQAVVALLREAPPITVSFTWQDEPGEYRWILRSEGDQVHIRVLWFRDSFSRQLDKDGEALFETNCALLRLARQVKAQLHQLRSEWSEAGYREKWERYDFPSAELQQLTTLFEERKQ